MSSFFHASYVSLSFFLSLTSPCFEPKWAVTLPFQRDERRLARGFQQKCRQSQTNLQMKNIKGAAPIVSLSCPGKIGSLRPKNDIVYINRGPWLEATMFVMLCCPPSLLPLPTGHFSPPPHNRSFEGFLFADKEKEWDKKEKESKGEKDKHGHNLQTRTEGHDRSILSVSQFRLQLFLFRTN